MISEIKTILYASDSLIGSRAVFKFAVLEAIKHQAKIIYLHVLDPIEEEQQLSSHGYLPSKINELHSNQIQETELERIVLRINGFLESEPDISSLKQVPEVVINFGKPGDCIINVAQKHNADLIVMGDRAKHALTSFFLGSTTQIVIRKSSIPVVVVPIKNKKSS